MFEIPYRYLDLEDSCDDQFIETEELACTSMRIKKTDNADDDSIIPSVTLFSCGPPGSAYQCSNGKCSIGDDDSIKAEKCAQDEAAFYDWNEEEVQSNTCTQYLWEKKCNAYGMYQRVQAKYSSFTVEYIVKFLALEMGSLM